MKFISDYIVPIGPEGLHIIQTGKWRTRKPVMDTDKCVKCGMCLMYCPVNSIRRHEDGRSRSATITARAAVSVPTSARRAPSPCSR